MCVLGHTVGRKILDSLIFHIINLHIVRFACKHYSIAQTFCLNLIFVRM